MSSPNSGNGNGPGSVRLQGRVLVMMSGGVDSSVAAWRLAAEGCAVEGAYLKNWINEEEPVGHCPWQEDIEDARAVAESIGIPFRVVNFMGEYRERVVRYLVDGYRRGTTPNPDVMCNREMKFGVFAEYARAEGFDAVATGHYCRGEWGTARIREGRDANKDQSYFLALVDPDQIRRARFPIGDLLKPEVRDLARKAGLPNADKKDSQGICFIGEVKINEFLEKYIPDEPGEIVDRNGRVLGEHRGLHRFTLGQRKGIGIPSNTDHEHYVVVGKEPQSGRLVVAFDGPDTEGLWQTRMSLHSLSWLGDAVSSPERILAKPRYRDPSVEIRFEPDGDGRAMVEFDRPQRALAAGQVCALYEGDRLLGGGIYG